jgi:hypothetical protein
LPLTIWAARRKPASSFTNGRAAYFSSLFALPFWAHALHHI